VHIVILYLQEEVLVNLDVGDDAVDGLHRIPSLLVAIGIILAIDFEPGCARNANGGIPSVSFACA
jgi:hypothetical protein